jgi:hypothetical protein
MEIIVFAKVFRNGFWINWEHRCTEQEAGGVIDSAEAKAAERQHSGPPLPIDYLGGVHYMFDIACGTPEIPRDGDTVVFGVSVDNLVIGALDEFLNVRRRA